MVMQVRRNFQITLPSAIRKRLGLKVGDILKTTLEKGRIVISPVKAIDARQSWFWTKEWQAAEKEAEEDIKSGRVKKFRNVQELIADLDK